MENQNYINCNNSSSKKKLEKLTMRAIISNISTTTFEIVKHLNKLLTKLKKSYYTILNIGITYQKA